MNVYLLPFTVIWMILATTVIGLILYRAWIARNDDERLHLHPSEMGLVSQQTTTARRLEDIDRWGQGLTILTLVCGLGVAVGYIYQNWLR